MPSNESITGLRHALPSAAPPSRRRLRPAACRARAPELPDEYARRSRRCLAAARAAMHPFPTCRAAGSPRPRSGGPPSRKRPHWMVSKPDRSAIPAPAVAAELVGTAHRGPSTVASAPGRTRPLRHGPHPERVLKRAAPPLRHRPSSSISGAGHGSIAGRPHRARSEIRDDEPRLLAVHSSPHRPGLQLRGTESPPRNPGHDADRPRRTASRGAAS